LKNITKKKIKNLNKSKKNPGVRKKPIIMVSSSVYGNEDLLSQVYSILCSYGWDVWMSHKGTLPVDSKLSAFGNCVKAVKKCDAYLGIIFGNYGTGAIPNDKSITHKEMEVAVKQKKKRWFLVKYEVTVARQLLRPVEKSYPNFRKKVSFKGNAILGDIRVLDMYACATRESDKLEVRTGNWVQPFKDATEVLAYVTNQLSDPKSLFPRRKF